jgi:UDP-N-acetylglucosamine 2-epimerase (non-hydrolysing)
MMSKAWIIVSDSGGVQEEAPTLGKALLVLRENTERSEAIDAGCAKLVGTPRFLADALDEACSPSSWIHGVKSIPNPFGDGSASRRIADAIWSDFGSVKKSELVSG